MAHVYEAVLVTLDAIDVLLEKFQGAQTIPFKNLPYEFQNRLIQLFPPSEIAAFKLAGYTALKYANKRPGIFSTGLYVVKNNNDYNFVQRTVGMKQRNAPPTLEKFDHAVEIVSGDYRYLGLEGKYTWKQAIHLMNVSKRMKHIYLFRGMQLGQLDFTDFCAAIVNWLGQQKDAIWIFIECHYFHLSFEDFVKQYVESRTSFRVGVTDNGVVIYQKCYFG
uniref:DUF2156 domain-containing protein n=1 Tax=Panagrellus redivivus TaxID=6233 RepID=A0A7E4W6J6_PANRE